MEDREPRSPVYTARGAIVGEDWAAVADAVNQRMAVRRIGQQELADVSGVSVSTVRQIQHGGNGRRVQNKTLIALARALGWPDDHLIRVLVGNQVSDAPGGATDREILAGIDRIEQRLDDVSRRLAAVEQLVTAQAANR
ncbi:MULTISPECIES: helix-turn-helix transcriptional regulator [unclassified Frankia]|uniref:helix-turn-helix domain-containing protein n=1 Tax=unclassified Frankia TaxID=2632575 RepID=UPI002AD2F1C5|nr:MULTISPECIES: helix-turn-helix transcriptional regulator [unclassified Frankia]